ncbi:MAG: terminase small subunit [Thalassobaculaceae bacterium]
MADKKRHTPGLTLRQRRYCELVALGNTSRAEAARQAGYSPSGARNAAFKNHQQPQVIALIDELKAGHAADHEITVEMVLTGLKQEAQFGDSSASRVRAWECLGRYLSMFVDRTSIETRSYADELESLSDEIKAAVAKVPRIKQATH